LVASYCSTCLRSLGFELGSYSPISGILNLYYRGRLATPSTHERSFGT
jgi:hypothetical protein